MRALMSVTYGAATHALLPATFLCAIAFVGNVAVRETIGSGVAVSLAEAAIVKFLLSGLFAAQARPRRQQRRNAAGQRIGFYAV